MSSVVRAAAQGTAWPNSASHSSALRAARAWCNRGRMWGERGAQEGAAPPLALAAALALVPRRGPPRRHRGRCVVVHDRAVEDLGRLAPLALQRAHAGHGLQHLVIAGLV